MPMQVARLGRRSYPPGWLTPYEERAADGVLRFQPYAGLSEESAVARTDDDVDFTAVLAGRIAVTPMSLLDGRWVRRRRVAGRARPAGGGG